MKKARIGIIGAGNIAREHTQAFLAAPSAELVGLCDRVPSRAEEVAKANNLKTYPDAEAMLKDPDIDAVVLAVPNYQHHPMCLAAAAHGKHILCEKPMALNVQQAQEMKAACREHGVHVLMGFCSRYMADALCARTHIQAGSLGEVYMARTDIIRQRGTPTGWFGNKEKSGGGPLIDIGVHMIDLAWFLMGKPQPVAVKALNFHGKIKNRHPKNVEIYSAYELDDTYSVEDSSHGLITFEGGRGLMYQASWSLNAEDVNTRLDLYGDNGGLSFEPLTLYREEQGAMTHTRLLFKPNDCFQEQAEHFAQVVLGQAQPLAPAQDGVMVERMLEGLYRSAMSGEEVRL